MSSHLTYNIINNKSILTWLSTTVVDVEKPIMLLALLTQKIEKKKTQTTYACSCKQIKNEFFNTPFKSHALGKNEPEN